MPTLRGSSDKDVSWRLNSPSLWRYALGGGFVAGALGFALASVGLPAGAAASLVSGLVTAVWLVVLTTRQTRARAAEGEVSGARTYGLPVTEDGVLRLLADLPAPLMLLDRDLRHIVVTERYAQENGLPPVDQMLGRNHYDVFGAVPDEIKELHRRTLAGEGSTSPRERWVRPDGEIGWSLFELKPWYDRHDQVGGIALYSGGIAQAIEAESEARAAAQHLRTFYNLIPHALWTASVDGILLDVSQSYLDETGATLADFGPDADRSRWVHPDDWPRFRDTWRRSLETGEPSDIEARWRMRDGSFRWSRRRAYPQRDDTGRIVKWFGITEDIQEQKRGEINRRESEERFRRIFEQSPVGIALRTADTHVIVQANAAFCRMLGYDRDEVVGLSTRDIQTEDVSGETDEKLLADLNSELSAERCLRSKAGKSVWARLSATMLQTGDAGPPMVLGFFEDVTERKLAEASLRQAQKMEAIGQLTGGIAHDFNNILAIIQGNLELLARRLGAEPLTHDMLGDALRAARRGAALTQQLLAYARRQPLAPRTINIAQLVSDTGGLLQRTLGATIELVTVIPDALWQTRVDPNFLENALVNLAVNARDAMPDGGRLTIEANNAVLDQAYADQNADVVPGPYVAVSVSDTGTGIPRELLDLVLEPFFTTKPAGQGSGLGLSMVYGFVKQSRGHLKIYSEPGHGTTVTLYLPWGSADGEPLDVAEQRPVAVHSPAGEVVLVVEDDPLVRKLSVRLLEQLGYGTLEAGDGPAALALLDAGNRVDLVLTDVVLPKGMNGPALAREARARRPGLPIVYMSGYTQNAIVHNGILDADAKLLKKPFLMTELAQKVGRVLAGGS